MSDIPAIAKEAQAKEITVIMDNTWASAMYFNAFEKGVDIVVEAVTKYICGHSDVMMGVIVSKCLIGSKNPQHLKKLWKRIGPG